MPDVGDKVRVRLFPDHDDLYDCEITEVTDYFTTKVYTVRWGDRRGYFATETMIDDGGDSNA